MARVVFVGVERAAAAQIARALAVEGHQIEQKPKTSGAYKLLDADIVFAGGEPVHYLSLLREVRESRPGLPFCRGHTRSRNQGMAGRSGSGERRTIFRPRSKIGRSTG